MKRHVQILVAFLLVVGCLLWTVEPALGQDNRSSGRSLGIGVFLPVSLYGVYFTLPTTLDVRFWLTDGLGLEGILLMVFNPSFPVTGVGGGLLLRLIDSDFLDVYTGGRALIVSAQIALVSVSVTGAAGVVGLEISPIHQLALSAEINLWAVVGSSFPIPAGISTVAPAVGLALHYYF